MKLDINIKLDDSGLLGMSLDELKKPVITKKPKKKKKKKEKSLLRQAVESTLPVRSEYTTVTI